MAAVPAVSVIIPVYNRAHCIARAVESALGQSFRDFEVIVVDNCSTDNTLEVLKAFGDRIRVIPREVNRGVSASRNNGIRVARGRRIAFLDSDDTWYPNKLERQMQAMEAHQAQACFTRCLGEDGAPILDIEEIETRVLADHVRQVGSGAALDSVTRARIHPGIQSLMVDKQLLDHAGLFDETLTAAEDTLLIFRMAFLAGFIYLDEPLVTIYRGTPGSITYDRNPEATIARLSCYIRVQSAMYWRLMETHPEKTPPVRRSLAYFASRRAEVASLQGQDDVARRYAGRALRLAGDGRTLLRSLWLLLLPGLFRRLRGGRS